MERDLEVAWAAGLFEGEGCMSCGKRPSGKASVQVRLGMSDLDVVERFARIVGCGAIHHRPPGTGGHKDIHDWYVQEAEKVREVIALLLPFLGERRREKALEVLLVAEGIRPHNAKTTHCPKGHPLSGENLVLEPFVSNNGRSYTARRCKTCRTEQSRNRARRRLGITPDRFRVPA